MTSWPCLGRAERRQPLWRWRRRVPAVAGATVRRRCRRRRRTASWCCRGGRRRRVLEHRLAERDDTDQCGTRRRARRQATAQVALGAGSRAVEVGEVWDVMGWCRVGTNAAWREPILANIGREPRHRLDDHVERRCGKVTRWRHGSCCCVASTSAVPTGWRWQTSRTWSPTSGHTDVSTYIQSGNVVLTSPRKDRATHRRRDLRGHRGDRSGSAVSAVLRTPDELRASLAANPFRTRSEGRHAGADHVSVRCAEPPTTSPDSSHERFAPDRFDVDRQRALRPLPERCRPIEDDPRLLREATARSRHRPQPQHRRQADRAVDALTTSRAMPAIAKLTVFALDCADPTWPSPSSNRRSPDGTWITSTTAQWVELRSDGGATLGVPAGARPSAARLAERRPSAAGVTSTSRSTISMPAKRRSLPLGARKADVQPEPD